MRQNSGAPRRPIFSPSTLARDPSIPLAVPTTSADEHIKVEKEKKSFKESLCNYLYNKEKNTFCDRTCKNWFLIVAYGLMYLVFLCTYTLLFLYMSLWILRSTSNFETTYKAEMLAYSENGIGLSATPTSLSSYPLIWYQQDKSQDYQKYINAIEKLLVKKRRKRDVNTDLGPCGVKPYGYGKSPCIVIRINKQFKWVGRPLEGNSTTSDVPLEVQRWMKRDKMLWLHCDGYHSYDKEHIGRIQYFPYPPGFDPNVFPLDNAKSSPLVAIQISNFTLGVSLAIECKLWYANGPSSIDFMLYVSQ